MINYKDLLILKLSGVTKWLNKKEMIIPKTNTPKEISIFRPHDHYTTCEFLMNSECILRGYYDSGCKIWEQKFRDGLPHGIYKGWHEDGRISWNEIYNNGVKLEPFTLKWLVEKLRR